MAEDCRLPNSICIVVAGQTMLIMVFDCLHRMETQAALDYLWKY
jgi:hypothetical protein